ncbi:MAG: hydrogenase maturation protease [Acidobacteria bacterium]|nr:hydrogenase maturation protease [Acidobacteriota bacterium]
MSTSPAIPDAGAGPRIVGLGTRHSGDDEIGLALVSALSRSPGFHPRCILLESADAATVATMLLEWDRPVVLVDAADMRLAPGESRCFSDHEASVLIKTSSVSTHGLGLAEGLGIARALGYDHPVRIFGVQPFDLSPGRGLSREMEARFPLLLGALGRECSAGPLSTEPA